MTRTRSLPKKLFDGLYIVSADVPQEKMASAEVVASYKKLGLVEEAFRSLKTVQLEVRPVQWHLKRRLEPFFAADGTHKDRQWTIRNVIELMPHDVKA